MLVVVWLAILTGFGYNNLQEYFAGKLTYPWIVHIHSVFIVGWLILFTVQVVLVRRDQARFGRRLSPKIVE